MELSYWNCICSFCVSKESAYLMLTSWDLACKQTWSPLLCLRITTKSHGWVREETERKEGRCGKRERKQYERKRGERRVGVKLKSLDGRIGCWSAQTVCFLGQVWLILIKNKLCMLQLFFFSSLLLFYLSFLSATWGCTTSTVVNVIKAPARTTVPTKIKQCLPGLQKLYSWTSSNLRLQGSVTAFRYVLFTFQICSRPLVKAECRYTIVEGDNTMWEWKTLVLKTNLF